MIFVKTYGCMPACKSISVSVMFIDFPNVKARRSIEYMPVCICIPIYTCIYFGALIIDTHHASRATLL